MTMLKVGGRRISEIELLDKITDCADPAGLPQADLFLQTCREHLEIQVSLCRAPENVVDAVFRDVVAQAYQTSVWRDDGMAGVRTFRDFRKAIPIRTYAEFRPYIDRIAEGQKHVLTRDEPYAFLKTSGTTGTPKLVPLTPHWRLSYRGPALYAQWGLYFKLLAFDTIVPENVLDLSWERHPTAAQIGSLPVYSITQRPDSLGSTDWTPPWYDAPWFSFDDRERRFEEELYLRLRLLAGRDVRLIVAVNPSKIIVLAEHLQKVAEQLIADVRNGSSGGEQYPGIGADPALARRLERALARNGGRLLLTDLWPNLSLAVCWKSASARLYLSWMHRLLPNVAILPFSTTGTEGIVTLPIDTHPAAGPLAINQGLYEFAPFDDLTKDGPLGEDVETLNYDELETGRTYRLVMTQANGLYRYDVGDIYRVVGYVGRVPRLEFVGRGGFHSSFTGEKLTENDICAAIARALEGAWATCPHFTCFPSWDEPPHYVVAIEWTGALQHFSASLLADRIERALASVNVEYADKRATNRLQPVSVVPLVPGAFNRAVTHRVDNGAASAQVKHHWLQRDTALLSLFDQLKLRVPDSAAS